MINEITSDAQARLWGAALSYKKRKDKNKKYSKAVVNLANSMSIKKLQQDLHNYYKKESVNETNSKELKKIGLKEYKDLAKQILKGQLIID